MNTAAQAVGRLEAVAAVVGQIEEWPGTDTEMDSVEKQIKQKYEEFKRL